MKQLAITRKGIGSMNTRQIAQAVAQRLPNQTQDNVLEVLQTVADVVEEELGRPGGYLYIQNLGRFHVDRHYLEPSGMLQNRYRPGWALMRLYFRFTPTTALRESVRDALINLE